MAEEEEEAVLWVKTNSAARVARVELAKLMKDCVDISAGNLLRADGGLVGVPMREVRCDSKTGNAKTNEGFPLTPSPTLLYLLG